mgnify:CR=1 FL=1
MNLLYPLTLAEPSRLIAEMLQAVGVGVPILLLMFVIQIWAMTRIMRRGIQPGVIIIYFGAGLTQFVCTLAVTCVAGIRLFLHIAEHGPTDPAAQSALWSQMFMAFYFGLLLTLFGLFVGVVGFALKSMAVKPKTDEERPNNAMEGTAS